MEKPVKLWCQYKNCEELAGEEVTVIVCKIGENTTDTIIHFCDWHRQYFEYFITKRDQLDVLSRGLRSPHIPPPPRTYHPIADQPEYVETFNLGKEEVERKPLKQEDEDDIPF